MAFHATTGTKDPGGHHSLVGKSEDFSTTCSWEASGFVV